MRVQAVRGQEDGPRGVGSPGQHIRAGVNRAVETKCGAILVEQSSEMTQNERADIGGFRRRWASCTRRRRETAGWRGWQRRRAEAQKPDTR
jgi:hypothetical protein